MLYRYHVCYPNGEFRQDFDTYKEAKSFADAYRPAIVIEISYEFADSELVYEQLETEGLSVIAD
jgi:hypothetical protein